MINHRSGNQYQNTWRVSETAKRPITKRYVSDKQTTQTKSKSVLLVIFINENKGDLP